MTITAAADGSALGNPGPAGWAWYIDETTWRAGGWPHGTNNMGELMAVLDLLEATASASDQHLHVLCDSQYVINSVTKWMPGWKRKGWRKKDGKPVMNVELLQGIDRALVGRSVDFEWVKGHAGHALNEAADRRANAAATAFSKHQDPQVGPGFDGSAPAPRRSPGAAAEDDGALALFPASGPEQASRGAGTSHAPRADRTASHDPAARGRRDRHPVGSDLEEVTTRELALLTDQVRGSRRAAGALLHPEFVEVGASGRRWDREQLLALLAPLDHDPSAQDLVADEVAPGIVLLTYTTRTADGSRVYRTSLWVRREDQWLLRHHQGTVAGVSPRPAG
ncbi:RNase H family protein [Brachybacterium sp. AOP25-B2-12]|uniref:RNase H family protein n=1 Tax=Brachybacterium sp. AOP25-B2-12 TaxID=3457710 RepID=UPI0040334050